MTSGTGYRRQRVMRVAVGHDRELLTAVGRQQSNDLIVSSGRHVNAIHLNATQTRNLAIANTLCIRFKLMSYDPDQVPAMVVLLVASWYALPGYGDRRVWV